MSDFRFGADSYRLNYHPHEGVLDELNYIDWSKVECVEIDWEVFVRERTCEVIHDQDGVPRCSNCQNVLYDEYKDGIKNYCDECGRKVER